ncbi:hypothetical protein D9M71_549810 [compost metagenome]
MPAHRVGIGVAGIDEIPLRLTQLPPLQPFELEALPGHLFALLAHLFALARTEHVEEVLEIPVTAILPVILTANALQPAGLFAQCRIGEWIGEIDVGAGKPFEFKIARQAFQQFETVFDRGRQQPRPGDRTEWHRAQQLGVVIDAGAFAGIGPGVIEHVLAVGMPLAITGQRGDQAITFNVQQMLGLPAGMGADTAAVFQCTQKSVTQKRLALRHHGIPGLRGDF